MRVIDLNNQLHRPIRKGAYTAEETVKAFFHKLKKHLHRPSQLGEPLCNTFSAPREWNSN